MIAFKADFNVSNEQLVQKAYAKLKECNADMIVANDVGCKRSEMDAHTSELLVPKDRRIIRFIADVKYNISSRIVKTIATVFKFYTSMNKLMADIVKLLNDLGVDLARTEHVHYKFESQGLMDLTVETWKEGEWIHVSIAHYYLQEGDLMADPEIEFRIIQFTDFNGKPRWEIQPIHYQQDGLGVYQEAMYVGQNGQILIRPKLQRKIKNFLGMWANNIKQQGYLLKQIS